MNSTIPFSRESSTPGIVAAWRQQTFLSMTEQGPCVKFALPMLLYSYVPLLTYLMIPQLRGFLARLAVYGINFALQMYIILYCRSANSLTGLAIGFLSGWNILWSSNLLIFNDAKRTFKKIERITSTNGRHTYQWQSYPKNNTIARFWWSIDLLFNSRGIGWDWKVSATPSRPPFVERDLQKITLLDAEKADIPKTKTGRERPTSRPSAIIHFTFQIITSLLLLDFIKQLINRDAYFAGFTSSPPPSYLPTLITSSTHLTSAYRSTIAIAFTLLILQMLFACIPLLCLLLSSGINSEAWLYPDQFGNYSNLAARGLAGLWGGWWHHLFRQTFQSGAKWLSVSLLHLKPRSPVASIIELIISFTLSGVLHAAASISMIGPTHPWKDMYMFFGLQPIGIIIELALAQGIWKALRTPKWMGWIGHLVYVHIWIILTFPFLTRDLARGGLFLYEPLPYSPLQYLGWGVQGDSMYRWQGLDALSWNGNVGGQWWAAGPLL